MVTRLKSLQTGWLVALTWVAAAPAQNFEAPGQSQYSGPAVLSRSQGSTFSGPVSRASFRPFVSFQGLFAQNLQAVTVDSDGNLIQQSQLGSMISAGVYGSKGWRKQQFGMGYVGGYSHYPGNQFFNGAEQFLHMNYTLQISRRFSLALRQVAGISTRQNAQSSIYQLDPTYYYIPQSEIFDNRTYFGTALADLTIRLGPRLSANVGGDFFTNRRRSSALFGVNGNRARGDIAYRLSRNSTLAAYYNFVNFSFTRAFGGTDVHAVGLAYSLRLGRNWELLTQAAGSRLESQSLTRVAIDPAVQAIVGSSFVTEAYHRVTYMPQFAVSMGRRINRGSLSVRGSHGVSPGNGVLLTSRMTQAGVGYSYQPNSRTSFNVSVSYDKMSSLVQNIGTYGGWSATSGVSYSLDHLVRGLYVNGTYSFTRRDLTNNDFNGYQRNWSTAGFGLSWSPGDYPLAFW